MLMMSWFGLVRLDRLIGLGMIKLILLTWVVGMLMLVSLTDVRSSLRLVTLGTLLCIIYMGSSSRSLVLSLILLLILWFGLLAACPKDAKLKALLETLLGFPGLMISGLEDGKGGQTLVSLSATWPSGSKSAGSLVKLVAFLNTLH